MERLISKDKRIEEIYKNPEKPTTLFVLYQKGCIIPIGIFDSKESLNKGKAEFKSIISGMTDERLYTVQFELNKVL